MLGWTHRWVEEDAFLNFRIIDQIRVGHGPVFNIGQRKDAGGTYWSQGWNYLIDLVAPYWL